MANYSKNVNTLRSRAQLTRFLGYPGGFRGVDLTSPERLIADSRLAHVLNMWKDYKSEGGACIETFPGWRRLLESKAGRLHGMWRYKNFVVVHIGHSLYALNERDRDGDATVIISESATTASPGVPSKVSYTIADPVDPSSAVVINKHLYLLDSENYWKISYDDDTGLWSVTDGSANAYQPTLYASHTKLDGEPQQYEQRNMLNDAFTESFIITEDDVQEDSSGSPTRYYLTIFAKINTITAVTLAGTAVTTDSSQPVYYGIDTTGEFPRLYIIGDSALEGKYITVQGTQPTAYFQDGAYRVEYAECIRKCRFMTEYDGRIFYSGNPFFPTKVWYSARDINAFNRPDYIGELNYWSDGTSGASNLSFLVANDKLCVLQRNEDGTGGIYIHYGVDSGADLTPRIYPSDYAALNEAPYGTCINFRDDPVFLTPHGLDAIGKQQVNLERSIEHRSTNVDGKLWAEDLANAQLCQFDGYLFIACPSGNVYLADSRQVWQNADTGDVEYEYYLLSDFGDYVKTSQTYTYRTSTTGGSPNLYAKRYERRGEDEISATGVCNNSPGFWEWDALGWRPEYVILMYETQGDPGTGTQTASGTMDPPGRTEVNLGWQPDYIDFTYEDWDDPELMNSRVDYTVHITADWGDSDDYIKFSSSGFVYQFRGTGYNDPDTRTNLRYTAARSISGQPTQYTVEVKITDTWTSGSNSFEITDTGVKYNFTHLLADSIFNPRYKAITDTAKPYYIQLKRDTEARDVDLADTVSEQMYVKTATEFFQTPARTLITKDFIIVDKMPESHAEPVTDISPAALMLASEDTLYFGSVLSGGDYSSVCCLNTDKRGKAYTNDLGVTEPVAPGTIHRHWYTRCGEGYISSLTTKYDDCGYPHVRKNTVRKSLDIELRSVQDSVVQVSWRTNRENAWHVEPFDNVGNNVNGFYEEDFANHVFDGSGHRLFVSDEHAKLWTHKQIHIRSVSAGSCFGLYHLSFRWIVAGRNKN